MGTHRDTTTRRAGVVTALLAPIVVLKACSSGGPSSTGSGGSPSTGGSSSSASASAVAYAACMRNHGVLNYPDPGSDGNLPIGNALAFAVSNSQYQAAQQACRHLLPSSDRTFEAALVQCLMTGDCPPDVVQPALTEGRTFARCMRNDGVPNWPDPTVDSMGRPSYQVTRACISVDDTRSGPIASKIGHCGSQTGAPLLRQE